MNTRCSSPELLVVAVCAILVAGCEGTGNLYEHRSIKPPAAVLSDPRSWVVTGNVLNAQDAVDGDKTTAARGDVNVGQASITVDLGKVCTFDAIFLDHGRYALGCARRLAVSTSMDGRYFTHHYEAPGTRMVTSLLLVTPVMARYVRIKVVEPGDTPWNVAEVYIQ